MKSQFTTRENLRQRGVTLLEVIVSLGIMGALSGVIVISSFAMLKAQASTNGQAEVAIEVSKSTRWLARDIHRAASSDLVVGAGAVTTADFTWDDGGVITTCTYSMDAGSSTMVRTCPSGPKAVANGITGLQFTRSGELVTASYTVTSSRMAGYTEDVVLTILIGGG